MDSSRDVDAAVQELTQLITLHEGHMKEKKYNEASAAREMAMLEDVLRLLGSSSAGTDEREDMPMGRASLRGLKKGSK